MLINYEPDTYQALNNPGWGYILTVKVIRWWGLSDKIVKIPVQVPYHVNADDFYRPKLNVWSTLK